MALTRPNLENILTNVVMFTDSMTVLHAGATQANVDVGFLMNRANGLVPNAAFYWSESTQSFVTALTANAGINSSNITVQSYANITAGSITGTLTTANQPKITTLSGVTSIGASGSTTLTGTLQTASQPNITSLGTLTGLVVSGTTNTGTITASTVNAATIGNVGAVHAGATLTLATQANIAGPTYLTNNTAVTSLQILGTAARGGAGYHDFLVVTNQAATTTPTKNFRLDSNGNLQIINSNYSNNIFTLTDAGALTVPSLYVNTGIFWAGNNNVISSGGGGSAPAGNTGQVQYNSGGTLGASTLYYWSSNNAITTTSTVNTGALTATTLTGALQTAAQPNITSVGTLTGLTLSGALTQSSTTAGTITSVLTHGADVNFQLTSQNGTSLNTTGQEVARFGINYNTAGWDSFTQYIRGSAAQNGNQVLWAANTAIATISTSGITLNTGTFTGTIGTSGANTTVAGGLVVAGNLYAQGTLTYVNTETVNTTEYVSTVNATNLYATTIGNIGANMVGTGTYLTSLNASNLSSGTVSASLIPTLNQNTTGSAGSLSGFGNPTTSSTASTIVYRDTNGYITNNYFYTSGGGAERNASGMGYFAGFNSSDYYIRSYSPAAVAAAISGQTMNIVGSASTATSASTAGSTAFFSAPDGDRNAATKLPTTSGHGVRGDFVSASSAGMAGGNYAGVLTYAPWDGTTASTGDASYQLAFGSTATNGSGYPQLNLRKGIDSTWNAWYNIFHSGQTNSPSADNTWNLGTASLRYATVYGVTFSGVSTTAKYADLAELYTSDAEYEPGTVVVFGGDKEITISTQSHDSAVAGIISTNPAYLMNSESDGLPVALTGRVPCRVQGPVTKGQVLVTSTVAGVAQAIDNSQFVPGCVVGKALEAINTNTIETIEVVVGRF